MVESEISVYCKNGDREIEDVINARKLSGCYNICPQNSRYVLSASSTICKGDEKVERLEKTPTWVSEGDLSTLIETEEANMLSLSPTDSEVTIVRVRREGLDFNYEESAWDMHDEAIPGDGTHLGKSPSMVNLVTLVGRNNNTYEGNDYLIPLSSWDPDDKPHDYQNVQTTIESRHTVQHFDTTKSSKSSSDTKDMAIERENKIKMISSPDTARPLNLARRISKFLRKHCVKKAKQPQIRAESEVTIVNFKQTIAGDLCSES